MFLTAAFKLRVNNHDERRLRRSVSRWHAAFSESLDRARASQAQLQAECLTWWESKDGKARKLVVDGKILHAAVLKLTVKPVHLHSSAYMSLIVAVEEQLKSWLGLLCEWKNGGKKTPRPTFPSVPPASAKQALARWELALAESQHVTTLREEDLWRAEVTRAAKGSRLPQYFGSAMSGDASQAHCGLLRREDGRYFALLTLFPQGDPLGEPVQRARNRKDRGAVRNVRSERDFAPTDRARASLMCPLEFERGHERLFFSRAIPKSADLIEKPDGFYLHVAFQFPDHAPREMSGRVLALKRGVGTLVAWSLLDSAGREEARGVLDGKDLARLVTEQGRVRAIRQAKGRTTAGDRRVSRVVEHHLYSAGHQIVDLACRHGAEVVLLDEKPIHGKKARNGRSGPARWLAYRHWHQLFQILEQLCREAGLPDPQELKVYGSPHTCHRCGWKPGEAVKEPREVEHACLRCGTPRDQEYHLARLVGAEALRRRHRQKGDRLGPLGEWLKTHPLAV